MSDLMHTIYDILPEDPAWVRFALVIIAEIAYLIQVFL